MNLIDKRILRETQLVIVEPNAGGHRMVYVRRLVKDALARGIRVALVTTVDATRHPAFVTLETEAHGLFPTLLLAPSALQKRLIASSNLSLKQIGTFLMFSDFFKKQRLSQKSTVVFVPYLDHIDKAVSIFGSPFGKLKWSGLTMQFKFHYSIMGAERPAESGDKAKEKLFTKLLKNKRLTALFTIDELLAEYARQNHSRQFSKLKYVADPVDMDGAPSRDLSRRQFGIKEGQTIILVFGALALRKGVKELIEAVDDPGVPESVAILLAGLQDVEVTRLLNEEAAVRLRNAGRLYEINRFLSDAEELTAFSASDIVWVGYKKFYGMSGVLVQAGKMGLPALACRAGLVGWLTKKYQVGLCADINDREATVDAIRLLAFGEETEKYSQNGRKLAASHTTSEFCNRIFDVIGFV